MTPEDLPTDDFHTPKNDMSHWWPILMDVDVPKPATYRIGFNGVDRENQHIHFDEEKAERIVEKFGGTAFVRSGYKSAQHDMSGGSIIRGVEDIHGTLEDLLFQHLMMEMPVGEYFWFRELLDLNHCHYCPGNLVPECRVFIRDGEVVCHHPRLDSDFNRAPDHHRETAQEFIESAWDPFVPEYEDRESENLSEYAQRVADAFDGNWSVDFVEDVDGNWWCTDMAVDALYDLSEYRDEEGWETISMHPGDCEHDWRQHLDDEYRPKEPEPVGERDLDELLDEIDEDA